MILGYIILFLFLSLSAAVLLVFSVFMFDSLVKGHDLPTSKRATKALIETIKKYNPSAKKFYDLGCAHGTLSLRLKKFLLFLEIYGIDSSRVRIYFAKIKAKILRRKVNFLKQDIFKTNLHDADVIYTYLWYDLMPLLEEKLQNELKQGAVVITNTSHFQNWQLEEKIKTYFKTPKIPDFETLFVYVKK